MEKVTFPHDKERRPKEKRASSKQGTPLVRSFPVAQERVLFRAAVCVSHHFVRAVCVQPVKVDFGKEDARLFGPRGTEFCDYMKSFNTRTATTGL